MRTHRLPQALLGVATLVITCFVVGCQNTSSQPDSLPATASQQEQPNMFEFEFNEAGDLIRPTGYRTWVFVGTPVTPNELNDGKAPFPEFLRRQSSS